MLNIENGSISQSKAIREEHHSNLQIHDLNLVTKQSSIDEKIACFRDYFKGREDVYALRGIDRTGKPTIHEFQVPASLERSRSGNGGHVWIFFDEPIAARTARMLGSILLTFTLDKLNQ